jgi:hypothetical protein
MPLYLDRSDTAGSFVSPPPARETQPERGEPGLLPPSSTPPAMPMLAQPSRLSCGQADQQPSLSQ